MRKNYQEKDQMFDCHLCPQNSYVEAVGSTKPSMSERGMNELPDVHFEIAWLYRPF